VSERQIVWVQSRSGKLHLVNVFRASGWVRFACGGTAREWTEFDNGFPSTPCTACKRCRSIAIKEAKAQIAEIRKELGIMDGIVR